MAFFYPVRQLGKHAFQAPLYQVPRDRLADLFADRKTYLELILTPVLKKIKNQATVGYRSSLFVGPNKISLGPHAEPSSHTLKLLALLCFFCVY